MMEQYISLPSKPRVVNEDAVKGTYEIDDLYPGYGHTLGNSLRRIILSSLPGAAITSVKIKGVDHEFSTVKGIKEDVISIILNLKKIRFDMATSEPVLISIKKKGIGEITAKDIDVPGQIKILNPEQPIAEITDKGTEFDAEIRVEKGIGYVPKEQHNKERVDIGAIAVDALFAPIRRVNYEVENMRVGDRTDFNRLIVYIETDGSISPKRALEWSIETMIAQLKAIVGFKESIDEIKEEKVSAKEDKSDSDEILKKKIDEIDFPARVANALIDNGVKTIGGLIRKKEEDVLAFEGMGEKGVEDIKKVLSKYNLTLK